MNYITIKVPDIEYEELQKISSSTELDVEDVARKLLVFFLRYRLEEVGGALRKVHGA
jgi:hypothetical protein